MNKCPVSEFCGGCQFQGIDYATQLEIKQKKAEDLLKDFHNVEKIIGMEDPDHYRNKIQISFACDEHKNTISGYYIPSSHMIVPVNECLLCDEKLNEIYISVRKILKKYRVSVFDERNMKGCIRHLLIRSTNLNEYMLVLVTGTSSIINQDQIVKEIIKYNPDIKTIIQNVNNRFTSAILSNRNNILYGKGYITDELCGLRFKISANSFYQVNKRQTEILYNTALDLCDLKENDTVIDAYCGTGTIGMAASRYVRKVIGVESNESAVKDALNNKKTNNIENIDFVLDDAGRYMDNLSSHDARIDVVIMDPPRAGSSTKFMSSMVRLSPKRVVYISCNPITLANDLRYLSRYYKIKKIQPVDMFSYTQHIETIVQLSRR
ncbi:MAG: 23S rRNA (uracil(1939)-C(5))-methyltransferase RlmD [Erysipelotrichaceae bacterium]|nr:23S rRNA (uracil(1939)-C(5))-methyltransferase RlmD [Erysipelotrichaceae bacterium]